MITIISPLYQYHQYSGWWYTYPSEKYEFVSWDDFPFPTEWKVIQNSMVPVTTNQLLFYPHYFILQRSTTTVSTQRLARSAVRFRKVEPECPLAKSPRSVPRCPKSLSRPEKLQIPKSQNFRQIRFMICLVVEPTPLKNMRSSVGMMKFPNIWKNKKCSKPPTSYVFLEFPNLN